MLADSSHLADAFTSGARSTQLHAILVNHLGRRIVLGEMPEGTTLVPDQLCNDFGVSRSVVREVFRALEVRGLVAARPKIGTKVTPFSQWNFLDPDVIVWRLAGPDRRSQLQDLHELRLAVEPIAAKLVSTQDAPSCLDDLREAIKEMSDAMSAQDVRKFTAADIKFHSILLASSGNRMFDRLSSVIATALRAREAFSTPFLELSKHGLELHETLVDKLAAGDPTATETMVELLAESVREVEAALEA